MSDTKAMLPWKGWSQTVNSESAVKPACLAASRFGLAHFGMSHNKWGRTGFAAPAWCVKMAGEGSHPVREKNKGRRNGSPNRYRPGRNSTKNKEPRQCRSKGCSTLIMTQRMGEGRSILQITPQKRKRKLRQYSMESQCLTSA